MLPGDEKEIPVGYLLERKETFYTTLTDQDCGFSETVPLDCFGKAIETVKDNPSVPNRLAKIFRFLGKQETAKGICNMALEVLQDPQFNWQAYRTRARTHMKTYLQDLEHAKTRQGPVPDRRKLMHAKNDLERVPQDLPVPEDNPGRGPVWAPCKNCSWWMKLREKAMEFDLGDTIPELQLFRGKCLWLKSQETLAMECFKGAIKPDNAGSTESWRCLWETLLLLFGQKQLQQETLVQEVEQWAKKVEEKCRRQRLQQELRAVCRGARRPAAAMPAEP
ncbi:LOW QUALITY PROTEIN: tetratricopeptide repeat protein 22 [Pluvialis apricaria]